MFSFNAVSPSAGRRYIIVRWREDCVRGTQLASRTTQTPLNTLPSFSPSSSALSLSLVLFLYQHYRYCFMCKCRYETSATRSYVSRVKDRTEVCKTLVLRRSSAAPFDKTLRFDTDKPKRCELWWLEEKQRHLWEKSNVPLCNIQPQMTPFSITQKGNEKKLKHQNACNLRATRSDPTGRSLWMRRLKFEKMFRYIDDDDDGFHFRGWYSAVQPLSFDKKGGGWCACQLWLQGRGGVLNCLSFVWRPSAIRLKLGNRRLKRDVDLCPRWKAEKCLCIGRSWWNGGNQPQRVVVSGRNPLLASLFDSIQELERIGNAHVYSRSCRVVAGAGFGSIHHHDGTCWAGVKMQIRGHSSCPVNLNWSPLSVCV